jgi:hypothetical protein
VNKKYYCSFERKVTEKVIERAWTDSPDANSDGYIDYLKSKLGEYDSIAAAQFDSYEEAEKYYSLRYPRAWKEDDIKIGVRRIK